jgi:hypothetical protein
MLPTTFEANRIAVGPNAKQVREQLLKLGMRRCSLQLIYRQCDAGSLRPSWLCLCVRWLTAIAMVDYESAVGLLEAMGASIEHLRPARTHRRARDWFEQIAHCAREHGEALQAAIQRHDRAAIRRELAESIEAQQELLAMLDRPARAVSRAA